MKNILIISMVCLFSMTMLKAQVGGNGGPLQERLNSLKIAYITEQLSLTSEEAQNFWPIYNEYTDELEKLKKENEDRREQLAQKMMASDDQTLEKLVDGFIASQKKEYEINLAYHQKYKEALPIRKIVLLYKAENEFKQKVFSELARRRMQERRNGGNK